MKYLRLISYAISVILIFGCTSSKTRLSGNSNSEVEKTLSFEEVSLQKLDSVSNSAILGTNKNFSLEGNDLSLSLSKEVIFSNDSVCVISAKLKREGEEIFAFEYIRVRVDYGNGVEVRDGVMPVLSPDDSFMEKVKKSFETQQYAAKNNPLKKHPVRIDDWFAETVWYEAGLLLYDKVTE